MIIGISKRNLLALPRAIRRAVVAKPTPAPAADRPRSMNLLDAFHHVMERQVDLMIRQMAD